MALTISTTRRKLCLIILAGAMFRFGWWWVAHPAPVSDYLGYRSIAYRLFENGEYTRHGVATAFRTPGYPAFLALGMLVSTADRWLSVLNVLLSIAAIPLVYGFASRIGLEQRTALVAAGIVAVSPTFILWSPVLGSENLQVVVLLAAWALCSKAVSSKRAMAAGVVLGIAVLVRPESIFMFAAVPFLIRISVPQWRRILALTATTGAGLALVVAPWIVRNNVVVGPGAGLSTTGGLNFYLAHRAEGYKYVEPSETPLRGLDELQLNEKGFELGMQAIRATPTDLVRTTAHSTYELLLPPTYAAFYSTRRASATPYQLGVSRGTFEFARFGAVIGWIVGALLAGLGFIVLARTRAQRVALLVLLAIVFANWFCFAVVFWGMPRYRFAIEPIIAIFAAVGLDAFGRSSRAIYFFLRRRFFRLASAASNSA
ncbi:MAG: glycosyltransferase family 39 protein [Acidimicrobiia bacterium]